MLQRDWIIVVSLLAFTFGLYERAARCDFINFDDDAYVFRNSRVCAGLTLDNAAWALTTGYNSNWHPLTWLSHMLDVQVFGLRAGAMHLENAAIHAINAALLFIALMCMTGARWPAAWVAAMFAAHPLHVESVAWISERKDVLSTLFMMLCILAYIRYVRRPIVSRYLPVVAMLILGLMCKPMLVTLPIVLLLLDFWPLSRSVSIRSLVIEKLPLLVITLISAAIAYAVQSAAHSVSNAPLSWRISNAIVSYATYLWEMVNPSGLAIFYPYRHWSMPLIAASASIVLALLLAAIATLRRAPYIAVGLLWYFVTLIPVIGLVQVGSQSHADRYTYVPLIGIFISIAWSANVLAHQSGFRPIIIVLGAATIVASACLTWRQIGYWRNAESLMRRAIDVVPGNYVAHSKLGEYFDQHGDANAAADEYHKALLIKPDDAISLNNLALIKAAASPEEAIRLFRLAIKANPYSAPAYNNYGNLLIQRGERNQAIAEYRAAIHSDPSFPQSFHNLALTLASLGKLNDAIELWRRAIATDPYYDDAHAALGNALVLIGQTRQGIDEMRVALRLRPDRIDTLNSLAWILATHPNRTFQDATQAELLARRAVELTHRDAPIPLDTLAAALARRGQFDQAAETAGRAAILAEQQNQPDLANQINRRLALYQTEKAYTSGRDR